MELGKTFAQHTITLLIMLYPLKFQPITKTKVWGFETWALSGHGDDQSVVSNGFLKDNLLSEVLEIYMDELVGEHVYDRYGNLFPLLFKFIDAEDDLSIQVHPDDEMAARYGCLGKTEMWYVTKAAADATIILGFLHDTTPDEVRRRLADDSIMEVLQVVPVKPRDVAYIPAGRVHALRKGTQVAEIQQTCDLTYRLYDYHRPGLDGQLRPLHIDESVEALSYEALPQPLVSYSEQHEEATMLVTDSHFRTNLLCFSSAVTRDYAPLDSFVVYMCTEGCATIHCNDAEVEDLSIAAGETVLIPAALTDISLLPTEPTRILEVYCTDL